MKKVIIGTLVVTALLLTGCGQQGSSNNNNNSQAVTSSKTVASSSSHTSTGLWNSNKDSQLHNFINQWAPTLGQSYTEYNGHDQLSIATGMKYPQDLDKTTVNGNQDSIGWAPSGKGSYDYNVVALYNYNRSGAPVGGHITYAFTFHNGQPVALVDQSSNGTPNWTPTKNTDVSGNFAKIANGGNSTFKVNSSSTNSTTASTNRKVHLTGGQSSINYITQKMGDQGWTIQGGTYGGAHGTPTDGKYVPYNTVQNSKGDIYYVYQNGKIEKQN